MQISGNRREWCASAQHRSNLPGSKVENTHSHSTCPRILEYRTEEMRSCFRSMDAERTADFMRATLTRLVNGLGINPG
jgi:hypothetical protein